VTYLAKVRNDSAKAEGHAAAGHEAEGGHKAETKKAEAAH
jgi:hypothetical protein